MKTVTLLALVAFIIESSGFLIKVPVIPTQPRGPSSPGWVHLQKLILPLFENVCEDSTNPVIIRLAEEFTFDSSSGLYLKPEVITYLQDLKTKGLMPKGEIFTNYNTKHTYELQTVYEVLFYAKNFDTFYQAAAWARQNVNCGLFVNAIYLAMINRRDTEKLSVPAPYELLPNYFVDKDVIITASQLLAGEEVVLSDTVRDEGNSYVLDANYTTNYVDTEDESKLAYFHEDVGLNTYYFLQKLKRSPWFNTTPNTSITYGVYLYHMMKQLAARYNLERYANGLPEVEDIDWSEINAVSYDPRLVYSNGNDFGYRTTTLTVSNTENIQLLQNIEKNMKTVVEHMRDTGFNKSQILNHVMEVLISGERSFDTLFREEIGKENMFSQSQPSVLDHYLTSLRDPMFWKINQKIVNIIDDAFKVLPGYVRNELYFPGVEVLNVDIKKMATSFDYFQFDVTDALKTSTTNNIFQVKINQPRLNRKSFAIKLSISSLAAQRGLVKLFLGPKIAPGELASNKNRFMLLDSFECNFKVGLNAISRSSEEMSNVSNDFTSLKTLRKNVEDSEFGLDALPLKNVETILGFPSRLLLPKGSPEGLPLQMFVFVAPFVKSSFGGMFSIPNMEFNSATLSPGYPLDLNIEDSLLYSLPNAMIKDVVITHKADKVSTYDGSSSKSWPQKNYDPSSQPNYAEKRKEPFDYLSKKSSYGKKEDYQTTKPEYPQDTKVTDAIENTEVSQYTTEDKLLKNFNDYNTQKFVEQNVYDKDNMDVIPQNDEDHKGLLRLVGTPLGLYLSPYDYIFNYNVPDNDNNTDSKV